MSEHRPDPDTLLARVQAQEPRGAHGRLKIFFGATAGVGKTYAMLETVPDRILEQADEVELVDLTPDDLLQRLGEGKVYLPQQAERAARNFFRKGNLIALRELALRRTAERVDGQMRRYKRDHAIVQTWPTAERLLVCINHNPLSGRLVRAARRMATALHAEWLVAYVETPKSLRLAEPERERVVQALRLAEQLGAETITLSGENVSEELLSYARTRNVSKIVVGKPLRPHWKELVFGSTVDDLVRRSGEIDVYVISGANEDNQLLSTPTLGSTSSLLEGEQAFDAATRRELLQTIFDEGNRLIPNSVNCLLKAGRFGGVATPPRKPIP